MLCHLSALSLYLGIPFGHLLGPLIIWYWKRAEYPFLDDQGKESLNFQLSMTVYAIVAIMLTVLFLGFLVLVFIVVAHIVLIIIASVNASKGVTYRYPYTIRFLT
jgi:uncharacterized Tic20 family protein